MTSYATSRTTTVDLPGPVRPDAAADGESLTQELGYQLCEFCEARGVAKENPASVCDCTPITRMVSGPYLIDAQFDTIIRIAEAAVLNHWAAFWHDAATITRTVVRGQCNDEYTAHVSFDGTLNDNLDETYRTDDGVARITGFTGDGHVQIGVTLAEDLDDGETEGSHAR